MVIGLAGLTAGGNTDTRGSARHGGTRGGAAPIDDAVAGACDDRHTADRSKAAGTDVGIIARYCFVPVLVTVHGRRVLAVGVVSGLDLLVVDQFLTFQYSTEEQAD